jgi:hypothetical protein
MDLLKIQTCRHVRRLNNWSWLRRCRSWRLHRVSFSGRFATRTEMPPDFVRKFIIEGTGVRFLVLNAQLRQILHNKIALHFQFTCQFVNPNLPHA